MVERFDIFHTGQIKTAEDGDWIRYSDYAAVSAQADELRANYAMCVIRENAELERHIAGYQKQYARAEAAEKRLAEVETSRDNYARQCKARAAESDRWKADRDRLISALREARTLVAGTKSWNGPIPQWALEIRGHIDAALSGSSDPRKDVARRCVELARREQYGDSQEDGARAALRIADAITSEFSLDTKERADAGE